MPGSPTTPGCSGASVYAPAHVAFRRSDSVGARDISTFAAQWLACTFPYRRFADHLAEACARLGADVVRYTFIVMDLHLLLLAGLPANRIIAFITEHSTVRRMLEHRGETRAQSWVRADGDPRLTRMHHPAIRTRRW